MKNRRNKYADTCTRKWIIRKGLNLVFFFSTLNTVKFSLKGIILHTSPLHLIITLRGRDQHTNLSNDETPTRI